MAQDLYRLHERATAIDPDAPKGPFFREMERLGVDVLREHAEKLKGKACESKSAKAEAYTIDETCGLIAVAYDPSFSRRMRGLKRSFVKTYRRRIRRMESF